MPLTYTTINILDREISIQGEILDIPLSCNGYGISEGDYSLNYFLEGQSLVCVYNFPIFTGSNVQVFEKLVTFTAAVGAHELGHTIGLTHTNDRYAIYFLPHNDDLMNEGEPPQFDVPYTFSTSFLAPIKNFNMPTAPILVQKADDILRSLNIQDT